MNIVLDHIEQRGRPCCRSDFQLSEALGHHCRESLVSSGHSQHRTDFNQGITLRSNVDLQQASLVER